LCPELKDQHKQKHHCRDYLPAYHLLLNLIVST
jgi:hypothetical protein